jgi:uncharacterized protein with PIN domain
MPKQCGCTIKKDGLATIFPLTYTFCPLCGKQLKDVSEEELYRPLKANEP